jgi:hypothetical protein
MRVEPWHKALTVCQPYAHLIALGVKPIENRTWETGYRGLLLIHAGKSRAWLEPEDVADYPAMAFGAVVAVAQLVACLHLDRAWPTRWSPLQAHEHAHGPWCWILDDIRRLSEPVPVLGSQGLWSTHPATRDAINRQLTAR